MSDFQRLPAEELFRTEIEALIANEKDSIPAGWQMSPRSVLTYITGGKAGNTVITPKYIGNKRLVEICIATLVTDRALLLIGEPGTAKSWLSEHLTAAINGDSTKVIQGTAGTTEEQIKYSWNYAMLIAKGPSQEALIKTPVFRAMETEVLQDLGKRSGLVIATGGGCVTRPENYDALHRNGTIVWLQRPTALLPTEGRPLSQAGRLEELYKRRAPLYAAFGDLTAENSGTPQETVEEILRKLEMGGAQ